MYNNLPGNALSKKKNQNSIQFFSRKLKIVLVDLTRKLSLCQLFRVHWIIIQKVTSLYRPLLKYWIDFSWKCNFNIRGIKLQAFSHFLNMLIKSKRWPTQWGTVIQEQWFEKWFYNNSTLSRQMQMNNISFIYQGMLSKSKSNQ